MNRKSVAILFVLLSFFMSCGTFRNAPQSPMDPRAEVFEAHGAKNEPQLLALAAHPDLKVRESAWRALANIAVTDVDAMLALAQRDGSRLAYFALSTQTLSAPALRTLEARFMASDSAKSDIARVLGLTGDRISRTVLLEAIGAGAGQSWEAELALAVNRRLLAEAPSTSQLDAILERAISADEVMVRRAWLISFLFIMRTFITSF